MTGSDLEQQPAKKEPSKKVSCKRSFDHPLLLNEVNLSRLLKYLQSKYQSVEVEAVCNDGTTYQFEDPFDFLGYENPDFRRVLEVTIRAKLYPEDKEERLLESANQCRVHFGSIDLIIQAKVRGLRNVSWVFVDGQDDRTTTIYNEVSRHIESFKPDYAPVYDWALSLGRRALFSMCITVLLVLGQLLLYRLVPLALILGKAGSLTFAVCLGVLSSHLSSVFYTRHAERFLSDIPPVLLALGDQSKRPAQATTMQSSLNNCTYGLMATLVISVACSLMANLLWEQAPKP